MSWPNAAALCALTVALTPGAAVASDFFELEAPDSFPASEPLGRSIARGEAQSPHFGDDQTDSGAKAYAAQGEGALYVWWAVGSAGDDPAADIRAAFDRIRRAPTEASPQAASVSIEAWDESLEGGIARADLEWRHLSNETLTMLRALAFPNADGAPRLVAAECVMHTSREDDVRPQCEDALDSLAIATTAAERGDLASLPEAEPIDVEASVPDFASRIGGDGGPSGGAESGGEGASGGSGPSIDAPEDGVLYERRDQSAETSGAPWLLLAGGLLVAAAVYVTVRRRPGRRSEREEERGE